MAAKKTANPAPDPAPEKTFTKEQLAGSKLFSHRRDVLMAVLEDGKSYTVKQAQGLIDNFFGRKV